MHRNHLIYLVQEVWSNTWIATFFLAVIDVFLAILGVFPAIFDFFSTNRDLDLELSSLISDLDKELPSLISDLIRLAKSKIRLACRPSKS